MSVGRSYLLREPSHARSNYVAAALDSKGGLDAALGGKPIGTGVHGTYAPYNWIEPEPAIYVLLPVALSPQRSLSGALEQVVQKVAADSGNVLEAYWVKQRSDWWPSIIDEWAGTEVSTGDLLYCDGITAYRIAADSTEVWATTLPTPAAYPNDPPEFRRGAVLEGGRMIAINEFGDFVVVDKDGAVIHEDTFGGTPTAVSESYSAGFYVAFTNGIARVDVSDTGVYIGWFTSIWMDAAHSLAEIRIRADTYSSIVVASVDTAAGPKVFGLDMVYGTIKWELEDYKLLTVLDRSGKMAVMHKDDEFTSTLARELDIEGRLRTTITGDLPAGTGRVFPPGHLGIDGSVRYVRGTTGAHCTPGVQRSIHDRVELADYMRISGPVAADGYGYPDPEYGIMIADDLAAINVGGVYPDGYIMYSLSQRRRVAYITPQSLGAVYSDAFAMLVGAGADGRMLFVMEDLVDGQWRVTLRLVTAGGRLIATAVAPTQDSIINSDFELLSSIPTSGEFLLAWTDSLTRKWAPVTTSLQIGATTDYPADVESIHMLNDGGMLEFYTYVNNNTLTRKSPTGQTVWTVDTGSSYYHVGGGIVYLPSEKVALDVDTGAQKWAAAADVSSISYTHITGDGHALVWCRDGDGVDLRASMRRVPLSPVTGSVRHPWMGSDSTSIDADADNHYVTGNSTVETLFTNYHDTDETGY